MIVLFVVRGTIEQCRRKRALSSMCRGPCKQSKKYIVTSVKLLKATDSLKKGLAYFNSQEDQHGLTNAFNALGIVDWQQQNLEQAEKHFEECLRIKEALHDLTEIAHTLSNLGAVYGHLRKVN